MAEKLKQAKVSDLTFDDKNFNKHTEYGMSLIEKSLRNNGAGRSILIDKNNRIIAGNGVVETAAQIGLEDVQIVESDGTKIIAVKRTDIDLDTKQGREMALADNATASVDLAWDEEQIQFAEEEFGMVAEEWGVNLDFETEQPTATEDDFDESTDAITTRCKKGDVWLLGEHRLMCGDSTSADDVAKLMDEAKADLTFTDPPYRLTTQGGGILKDAHSMKQVRQNKVDEFDPMQLTLYSKTNIYTHNKPLIKDYITLAEREKKPYDLCVYKKQGLPNYKGHMMTDIEYIAIIGEQDPQQGYDFKMYSKVYEGRKDKDNELSYSKPIGLCEKFILLYSQKNDSVLDLFGGTGTTLIACEQLNRKCFMMELDPHYCDVIIARWEKLTGKNARRITDGI